MVTKTMIKHCIICGAEFSAPPSSKKITCSPACSKAQKRISHTGKHNTWPAKSRLNQSATMREKGFTDQAKQALKTAMTLPESQRGQQHRSAKIWTLIDPDGAEHTIVNLLDWSRRNAHLFDVVRTDADRERVAANIRSGFEHIARSIQGRMEHPVYRYKGWGLAKPPESKR